jgi:hypothetical protein
VPFGADGIRLGAARAPSSAFGFQGFAEERHAFFVGGGHLLLHAEEPEEKRVRQRGLELEDLRHKHPAIGRIGHGVGKGGLRLKGLFDPAPHRDAAARLERGDFLEADVFPAPAYPVVLAADFAICAYEFVGLGGILGEERGPGRKIRLMADKIIRARPLGADFDRAGELDALELGRAGERPDDERYKDAYTEGDEP